MAFRKKIIAGNWKMHKTATEARELAQDIVKELSDFNHAEIVLCPPFTAISVVAEILSHAPNIRLGAQNVHFENQGAYTGEISAPMLRDIYVRYVIIGHSERRQYFGEDDALINRKLKAAIPNGLKPILCIGETLSQRQSKRWPEVLESQVKGALEGISAKEAEDLIIAYEPVWAIGTGHNATPAQAQEAHTIIRRILAEFYSDDFAQKIRIQYGGSVKPDNAAALLAQPDIDGALVGGASLDARSFTAIVKSIPQN